MIRTRPASAETLDLEHDLVREAEGKELALELRTVRSASDCSSPRLIVGSLGLLPLDCHT